MSPGPRNVVLLAIVMLLAGLALVMRDTNQFRGADDQSTEAIGEIAPDHSPWAEPVFDPADFERYVFGLQSLIGAGVVAFSLGWLSARHDRQGQGTTNVFPRGVRVVVVIGLVATFALSFVDTDNGELQAFTSALQGIGLATLLLPLGRWAGSRAADSRTNRQQPAA
jgi:cobalt/nickel transport protein